MGNILSKTLAILGAVVLITTGTAYAQPTDGQHVQTSLHAEGDSIFAGQPFDIIIQQNIEPHWHTYWKNPGDSGAEPKFNFYLPDGFTASEVKWPTPEKILISDLMNYGYEHEALFTVTITPPKEIKTNRINISLDAEWLVCQESCIPESGTYELNLKVGKEPFARLKPSIFGRAYLSTPKDVNWINSFHPSPNGQLTINLIDNNFTEKFRYAKDIEFYPEQWGLIDNPSPAIVTETVDGYTLSIKSGPRPVSAVKKLPFVLTWLDTKKNRQQSIRATADLDRSMMPAAQTQLTATTDSTEHTAQTPEKPKTGFFTAIILALLGGLVLNLMPCVFPVLSMKALSLVKLGDSEQRAALHSGYAYTVGVLITFLGIAAVLIALKAGGQQIGWGFQLQNPLIITLLAWLLFIIGLNLSGFFDFTGSFINGGQGLTQKTGLTGSFFTGALATLVATPCTAPFMGVAMGYALTQPAIISLTIFLFLGLGLALPYLTLCAFPTLRHFMPKPGHWMVTFKQILAFPMYASAIWLTWVLTIQLGDDATLISMGGMLAITIVIWNNKLPASMHWAATLVRIALTIIMLLALIQLSLRTQKADLGIKSHDTKITTVTKDHSPYSKNLLNTLLKDDNPIFINMTAAWCITCKINEKIALSTDETKQIFQDHNVHYLKGDWTNYDQEITQFLETYDRNGVPLYIYYGPRDEHTEARPAPVVLPQLLTPSTIQTYIEPKD